ncbi:MAG: hypothetical protein QXV69_09700 [Sulfolobaceae archaeon]
MATDFGNVVWDVFFKYPFWGSYIASYVPIKALAAGSVFILGFYLWYKKQNNNIIARIGPISLIASIIYFLLSYLDLATVEFALSEGTPDWCSSSNLCGSLGRPIQVFITPNPTSFVAWGAWVSVFMIIITALMTLYSISQRFKFLRIISGPSLTISTYAIKTVGIPISLIAGIYTGLLFNEATARGLFVDPSIVVLYFLYMLTMGFMIVYLITGNAEHSIFAKISIYLLVSVIGLQILQITIGVLGFYRLDAQYASEMLLYGTNPFMQSTSQYGLVSVFFKLGLVLWVIALILSILGYRKILGKSRLFYLISIIIFGIGIGLVEFSKLLAVQFIPNS